MYIYSGTCGLFNISFLSQSQGQIQNSMIWKLCTLLFNKQVGKFKIVQAVYSILDRESAHTIMSECWISKSATNFESLLTPLWGEKQTMTQTPISKTKD